MGERPSETPIPDITTCYHTDNPDTPIPLGTDIQIDHVDPDQLLTSEQVADLLIVHKRTVEAMLNSGELIGVRIKRMWRVWRADLRAFIMCHRSGKP